MIKETGGSAFPNEQSQKMDGSWNDTLEPGMTLRDYFAAKAMQGILSNQVYADWNWKITSAEAYEMADAMIGARK